MNEPSIYLRRMAALDRLDEACKRLEVAQEKFLVAQAERDAANAEWATARYELDALTKVGAA